MHCSQRERRADEAERDVESATSARGWKSTSAASSTASVTGVTSFGLFVELDESQVNGLVHITQLPNDYYHFDPIAQAADGRAPRR